MQKSAMSKAVLNEPDAGTLDELNRLAGEIRARFAGAESRTIETDLIMLGCRKEADVICKCIARPSITVLASGCKEADLAGRKVVFRKGTLLALAVDLPDTFVVKRTEDPDLTSISLVIQEDMLQRALDAFPPSACTCVAPATVLQADAELVCAFRRLLAADGHPAGDALMRLAAEEILLRVLATPAGPMLKRLYNPSSVENRIRRSVNWLQAHYRETFDVSTLAADAGMSEATYYRHFRSVINVSPRQYIKHLRLTHARRLMLEEKLDASQAAFEVGYESPNHFNREYKRLFGASPRRHVMLESGAA